ncbi:MAG: 16S rRNA (adenine(1518)-N(6)/adenine(1519)-N(6))-dimethyltransferase RsmA [Spirochaetaceae bacterium]|nr:16S rRNA (adenine(1518)-N(6)/adenine(1519)-N(6))-dimethyltransferase RsmA [Spirochaetaceae bacterium]
MPPLNYDSPLALKAFLDERGLGMRKRLGQNFLINPCAREQLLDALDAAPGARVWEIGSGLGAMTRLLLERGAAVTAFEIDKGFIPILREFFGGSPAFTLIEGDVLKTWRTVPPGDYLFGNLPYTIGAVLLADFIEKNRFFTRMVITVQKEVARRMAAAPGSKDYSSFSVLCASAYTVRPLLVMKGASFYPEPRVDSQGVRLDLRTDRDPGAYPAYFRPLLRCLFAARRKTVKNNLERFAASVAGPGRNRTDLAEICGTALKDAGIAPNERAERLGLDDFAALARSLEKTLESDARRRV